KRAYCLKIQPATGSFARNLIYSTKPVLVIRSSNSKNTLEEFHEFFGNFKPNNSTARVEVIDQSVLEPFWRF
ncbi:hypothetical protein P2O75_19035, partial [Escherichia coli]